MSSNETETGTATSIPVIWGMFEVWVEPAATDDRAEKAKVLGVVTALRVWTLQPAETVPTVRLAETLAA